jgi:hypothetical protein
MSYGNARVLILLWTRQINTDIMVLNWKDVLFKNQCGLMEILLLYALTLKLKVCEAQTPRNIVASM